MINRYRTYFVAAAMTAMLVCGCGKSEVQTGEEPGKAVTKQEVQETPEEENNLEENSHASVERLIEKYCASIAAGDVESLEAIVDVLSDEEKEKIQSRAAFIESFDNVKSYTKKGPVEDSFIVFVCYDMKLINIQTPAPDIICLYVSPKDDGGGRRIHYGDIDESMLTYVAELEKDPEVQALYSDVSTRYQEAQANDEALAAFISKITGQVTAEPEKEETEEMSDESQGDTPEAETAEEEEAQPEDETSEDAEEEETGESSEATAQNRETRVTESVKVRKEPSTESERLAVAYQGEKITQIESYDNGWSKVEFKGLTGYVKTEFLE
ncbi:MAG: SH3 domain-containing protein [Lachnospiraceae bacterium]|nr:SH3 domain-containing protein [Lachnospiraceae bacterium]